MPTCRMLAVSHHLLRRAAQHEGVIMTVTTERGQVQEHPSEVPSPEPSRRHASTARIALGWAAVIARGRGCRRVRRGGIDHRRRAGRDPVCRRRQGPPALPPARPHGPPAGPATSRTTRSTTNPPQPLAANPATPVWTGDVKDHPLYHQPAAAAPPHGRPVWTGDVKDHPLYHQPAAAPVAANPATPVWTGDVKDHPLYRRPAAAPTAADPATPVWTGDVKDHPLYHQPATG